MSKLIDADNILQGIEELKKSPWYNDGREPNREFPFTHLAYVARKEAVEVICDLCIKQEPAVDAKPVRHGRWIETTIPANTTGHGGMGQDKKRGWLCSVCRCAFDAKLLWADSYCPNCGAAMDGDKNAAN